MKHTEIRSLWPYFFI